MIRSLPFLFSLMAAPATALAASCNLSVTDVSFGEYRSNQTLPSDSTGMVNLSCDGTMMQPETVMYSITLGPSGNGRRVPRAMRSGTTELNYNLYTDAAKTMVWGDGSEGTQTFAGQLMLPTTSTAQHAVHGRLFERQAVIPGSYSDANLSVRLAF